MAKTPVNGELRIWEIEPVCQIALLELCIPKCSLCELIRKHNLHCCEACFENPAAVLQVVVHGCSSHNAFSREVDRTLNWEYAPYILEVQSAMLSSLRQRLACAYYMEANLPGMLCGLLRSTNREKRKLGHRLAYSCVNRGLATLISCLESPPAHANLPSGPIRSNNQSLN